MAIYCISCGTQAREGAKFCYACGAQADARSAPAAPVAPAAPAVRLEAPTERYYSPPPPAMIDLPPAAPRPRSTLKVVLLTLAVVAALAVVSLVGAGVFIKKVVVDRYASQVKFDSKPQVSEADLGVPLYPGAAARDGGGSVSLTPPGGKRMVIGGAAFTTEDGVDEVVDFYRKRLGDEVKVIDTWDEGRRTAVLQVAADGARKIITVAAEGDGGTKITIATIGSGAAR